MVTISENFHQDSLHAAFLLRKFEVWKKKAKKRSERIVDCLVELPVPENE